MDASKYGRNAGTAVFVQEGSTLKVMEEFNIQTSKLLFTSTVLELLDTPLYIYIYIYIYVYIYMVNYKSQLCLHVGDLFLAFDTTLIAEEKMNFARRVKTWGYKFIAVPSILIFTTGWI